MKKCLLAIVVTACLSFGSQASASHVSITEATTTVKVVAPETEAVAARSGPVRNILRGLIELERRKNAWLRRTFG